MRTYIADLQVDIGLYIGVNGCSLKTEENLQVARAIPLDRLLLETGELRHPQGRVVDGLADTRSDAPWCTPTSSHASQPHLPPSDSSLLIKRVSKPQGWKEGFGIKGRMEPADVRRRSREQCFV